MKKVFFLQVLSSLLPAVLGAQALFTDVTFLAGVQQLGLNHGVAIGDFDNDGREDIFCTRFNAPCALYRNLGGGVFVNVAAQAGVAFIATATVASWADIDNDGWLDLYVGCRDHDSRLYRNRGDGTFEDITASAGVATGKQVRAALWSDINLDGDVDLYVARLGMENILFLNNGNNTFTDVTAAAGVRDSLLNLGAVFFDYDNDGDADLYLTHDANQPFILYRNNGNSTFTDVSAASGANLAAMGMGVDFGDIDNDGWLDLYITNLYDNALLRNNGNGTFSNVASFAGVNDPGMGWGCNWLDFDNDGWQDIYVANDSYFTPVPNRLYRNTGTGTFLDVAEGTVLMSMEGAYGSATFDYNGDGKVDIMVANSGGTVGNQLFRNDGDQDNNWVRFKLRGVVANRAAIGARVTLDVNGMKLTDEVTAGSGYAGQNSLILHFGLGQAPIIPKVTVRWPGGDEEVFEFVSPNKTWYITQGTGIITAVESSPSEEVVPFSIDPNPVSGLARIEFELPEPQPVVLKLFDATGRLHDVVFRSSSRQKHVSLTVDAGSWPRGMDVLVLEAGPWLISRRIVVE